MAEPSKDRDKAVDEALGLLHCVRLPSVQRETLELFWQRAQEAEREADDWLECAADEIGGDEEAAAVLLILRKHRDEAIRNRAARASEEPKA